MSPPLPLFRDPVVTVRGVTQFRGLVKNTKGYRAQGSIEANSAVVIFGLQGAKAVCLGHSGHAASALSQLSLPFVMRSAAGIPWLALHAYLY